MFQQLTDRQFWITAITLDPRVCVGTSSDRVRKSHITMDPALFTHATGH